ncbi:FecR family protein [Chitinophaga arvensicola]|uniref:Ferric-dicitrate binding protein FerR, regulates iron transport through sigma-19 n=1 Tax=Chitinophaga arvensicola TaxID=29529 RepID=A0A1I0S989_9BACT|nr:FecR family protein [Chitinophaga arvensicola]SEW52754.1 protein of unknown function [Chitinophaga arvensicola]
MDHQLLEKYFQGKCNDQEKAEVETWLAREENLPDTGMAPPDEVLSQEWDLIRHRISRSQQTIRLKKILSVAATVCLLFSISIFLFYRQKAPLPVAAVNWKTMEVPNGRKAQLLLSDGSTLQLNGGTTIAYEDPFTASRNVKVLKGEVFFDIAKDPAHPFNVYTPGDGTIQVLGTRFNVKQHTCPNTLEITLNSGKISFSKDQATVYLQPGEKLIYDLTTHTVGSPLAADTLKTALWRGGSLAFRDTPIQQVFSELEQQFGVTFILNKKIGHQLFTAELNHESLPAILQLITLSSDLKFKTDGDTIHVY